MLGLGILMTIVIFLSGLWFYRRSEHRFADTI
jgi:ABC-type polysaccharide/polyol phosphate export permease